MTPLTPPAPMTPADAAARIRGHLAAARAAADRLATLEAELDRARHPLPNPFPAQPGGTNRQYFLGSFSERTADGTSLVSTGDPNRTGVSGATNTVNGALIMRGDAFPVVEYDGGDGAYRYVNLSGGVQLMNDATNVLGSGVLAERLNMDPATYLQGSVNGTGCAQFVANSSGPTTGSDLELTGMVLSAANRLPLQKLAAPAAGWDWVAFRCHGGSTAGVPTWNGSWAGADFTHIDFINRILTAVNERFFGGPGAATARIGSGNMPARYTLKAAGDPFLTASDILDIQADFAAGFGYFNPPQTYAGQAPGAEISWGDVDDFLQIATGITGWARDYPREFATLASATHADGSAFANGQKARCRADARVYTRVAGAWVDQDETVPDRVSTTGNATAGDYVTVRLFEQIRDALNALEHTTASGSVTTAGTYSLRVTDLSGPVATYDTWGEAKTLAEGAAPPTTGTLAGTAITTGDRLIAPTGPPQYTGTIAESQFTPTGTEPGTYDQAYTVDVYLCATIPAYAGGADDTFDANGTGLANGVWSLIQSVAVPAAGGSWTGSSIGPALPGWCDEPAAAPAPVSGTTTTRKSKGYQLTSRKDVLRYTFTHNSSSP